MTTRKKNFKKRTDDAGAEIRFGSWSSTRVPVISPFSGWDSLDRGAVAPHRQNLGEAATVVKPGRFHNLGSSDLPSPHSTTA